MIPKSYFVKRPDRSIFTIYRKHSRSIPGVLNFLNCNCENMYIYRHKLLHVSNVPLKTAFDFNVYHVYIALIEPSVASVL